MHNEKNELKYQFWGWILFNVCGFIFIASSMRMGDVLMLIGSLFFLAACFLFLIPLIPKLRS